MSSGSVNANSKAALDKAAKLEALKEILETYDPNSGTGLFDAVLEEKKSQVRKRALKLLDYRARSHAELKQRLLDLEFPETIIDAVITDLSSAGLLDDRLFATEWVRQRSARRGKSRRVLNHELQKKGISKSLRDAALAQISDSDEFALAQRLAHKKANSIKTIPEDYPSKQKELRKIVGVLARRGFPEGLSLQVGREALDERISELENSEELKE
ncbi:recombination regulator RecX [Corynebacterium caspium]|uniref:recombination regulator RecX n=1 Tax=Corynebacterium caspium TaxID=234828 RepID=UPI0003724010|nr:recombination regulator RecX [Corynebacterium caspium]WKD59114.1 Regulatory protein RecX [Corynebacterium caspium DSM 44850]